MFNELKKLFSSRFMWVILAIAVGFSLYNMLSSVMRNYESDAATTESIKEYSAQIDAEGLSGDELCDVLYESQQKLEKQYYAGDSSIFEQYAAAEKAYKYATYVYKTFPANRMKIVENMEYDLRYSKGGNSRMLETAVRLYNRNVPLSFTFTGHSHERTYEFFNNKFSEIAMLALIAAMSVRIFSVDRSTGAYRLIDTTRKSQRTVFRRQLSAVCVVALFLAAVLAAMEVILSVSVYGLSGFMLPVQQLEMYEMCPFSLTIAGFYLVKFISKLMVYFMVVAFSAFCAVFFKRTVVSDVVSVIFSAGGQLVCVFYLYATTRGGTAAFPSTVFMTQEGTEQYDTIRALVPQGLLNISKYMEKFDYMLLFGIPINRMFFCLGITVLLTVIFTVAAYCVRTRNVRGAWR